MGLVGDSRLSQLRTLLEYINLNDLMKEYLNLKPLLIGSISHRLGTVRRHPIQANDALATDTEYVILVSTLIEMVLTRNN